MQVMRGPALISSRQPVRVRAGHCRGPPGRCQGRVCQWLGLLHGRAGCRSARTQSDSEYRARCMHLGVLRVPARLSGPDPGAKAH